MLRGLRRRRVRPFGQHGGLRLRREWGLAVATGSVFAPMPTGRRCGQCTTWAGSRPGTVTAAALIAGHRANGGSHFDTWCTPHSELLDTATPSDLDRVGEHLCADVLKRRSHGGDLDGLGGGERELLGGEPLGRAGAGERSPLAGHVGLV